MIKLILIIIIAIGVKIIYDAREIVEKYFSSSFSNLHITILKICGWIAAIAAGIIYCYIG